MNDILTIMLVEDDKDTCEQIVEYADTFNDIRIIKITNNSTEAYNYTVKNMPDAVILDLELNEGGGNGLDFLTKLSHTLEIYKPFILLTTHNVSTLVHEEARNLGADFILAKYSKGYTNREPINFLRLLRHTLINNRKKYIIQKESSNLQAEDLLYQNIQKELEPLNFRKSSKGYKYLCDIIYNTITHNLNYSLEDIANKYNKTVPSIERAMQRAIKRAWDSTDVFILLGYYKGSLDWNKGHPTLKKFVLYYSRKLIMEKTGDLQHEE